MKNVTNKMIVERCMSLGIKCADSSWDDYNNAYTDLRNFMGKSLPPKGHNKLNGFSLSDKRCEAIGNLFEKLS